MITNKRRYGSSARIIALAFLFVFSAVAAGPFEEPSYIPVFVDDMEVTGAAGETWYNETDGRRKYDSSEANSGSRSVKVAFLDGSNWFAGASELRSPITSGQTVWYRVYLYFPSTTSFSGTATQDYFGWGKFLMLSPARHNPPRMYVQLPSPNQKNFGDAGFHGAGLRIDSDGLGTCNFNNLSLPRDRWFALQFAWKLDSTAGWSRLWVDEEFVGECASWVSSDYSVQTWGIGNYWNGGAWVQGESTPHFWLDDVVITTATPNTTDSAGRPYVHPGHFATKIVRPNSPVLSAN